MSAPARWDPADYAANASAQTAWGSALHERLRLDGDETVFDLGCGDGRLTAALAARVPRGRVVGFDADPEMVAHARRVHAAANLEFVEADARAFAHPRRADAVVSSATLHWVAEHDRVLARCRAALAPGGRLLLQMGGRGNCAAILAAAAEVAASPAWARLLPELPHPWCFFGPERYEAWAPAAGFRLLRAELLPRAMTHDGPAALAGWIRTTWMPILDALPEARRAPFVDAVIARYLRDHPVDGDGRTSVAMVRLEVEAVAV